MAATFKDHFSPHADRYAQARPTYPAALFDWLASQCDHHALAWDAGCGNGQAACDLAARFARVVATDPSAAQIAAAAPHAGVEYRVEPAEQPSLDDASVDLVTVAQAMHWFEPGAFHSAVHRVLRPGGVIAAWSYGLCHVDAAVDAVFMRLYDDVLGPFWPPERVHVESGYRNLPFPYEPLHAPAFVLLQSWTLPQYLDYLRSWSASQRYQRANGEDSISLMAEAFAAAWGEPTTPRDVRWPLAMRAGRMQRPE